MAKRFVVIGGGPAGNQAATHAARLGAHVTLIENEIVGGAAHLLDCIPSKAMIATGSALSLINQAKGMGLSDVSATLDLDGLRERIASIESRLQGSVTRLLESQGVKMVRGTGRLTGPHTVAADTAAGVVEFEADVIVLATGSRPRIPDWATVDGCRVLSTRDAYPPPELPEHLIVIGAGVTGVEFVHMFSAFGSQVSFVISRQQVLPQKDPEVAAALEEDFVARGVRLLKGARAERIEVSADDGQPGQPGGPADDGQRAVASVFCDDGRVARGSHVLLAIGSIPNSESLGLAEAGVDQNDGYVVVNHNCQSSVPHIYGDGVLSGKLPLSSVAAMQGRKIAEHAMGMHVGPHRHLDYEKAASAIFTVPEIADVGLAEADAFSSGRKIRVTKVPFTSNAKALIDADPRGFVKIVSDPATGVVLGGSIVGRHAAELISVVALAVTAGLRVTDIVESLLVHPALAEALADAAE
jgi:pyruvate/2-oxoglutarate dehydrogenase complex dihydrolipoamide dehydrogenase (E3) component